MIYDLSHGRTSLIIGGLAAALFSCANPVCACQAHGSAVVYGTVADATGAPQSSAQVSASAWWGRTCGAGAGAPSSPAASGTATSDSAGRYRLQLYGVAQDSTCVTASASLGTRSASGTGLVRFGASGPFPADSVRIDLILR